MKKTVLLILFTMLLFTSCNRMNNGSEPEQSAVSNVGSGASQSEEININNFTISEIIYPKINDISTDYEVEKLTISSILINEAYNLKFINDNNILFNKEVASGNDYSYPLYKFNIQSEELILLDEDFVMAPHAYLKVIDVNNFYLIGKYEFLTIDRL